MFDQMVLNFAMLTATNIVNIQRYSFNKGKIYNPILLITSFDYCRKYVIFLKTLEFLLLRCKTQKIQNSGIFKVLLGHYLVKKIVWWVLNFWKNKILPTANLFNDCLTAGSQMYSNDYGIAFSVLKARPWNRPKWSVYLNPC